MGGRVEGNKEQCVDTELLEVELFGGVTKDTDGWGIVVEGAKWGKHRKRGRRGMW